MHGKTGAKLDSEMSQITRKMKQTTPGEGKKKKKREKKTTQESVEQGLLAQEGKKSKPNRLSFCSTYFRQNMTKTTLTELEESKSNRQVCLTVS